MHPTPPPRTLCWWASACAIAPALCPRRSSTCCTCPWPNQCSAARCESHGGTQGCCWLTCSFRSHVLGKPLPAGHSPAVIFAELAFTYEQHSVALAAGDQLRGVAKRLAMEAWQTTVALKSRNVKDVALEHFLAYLDDPLNGHVAGSAAGSGVDSLPPSRRSSARSGEHVALAVFGVRYHLSTLAHSLVGPTDAGPRTLQLKVNPADVTSKRNSVASWLERALLHFHNDNFILAVRRTSGCSAGLHSITSTLWPCPAGQRVQRVDSHHACQRRLRRKTSGR